MVARNENTVDRLVKQAVDLGADLLDVEYRDGYEEVFVMSAGVGNEVARVPSSSPEGMRLRRELHQLQKRRLRLTVDGLRYDVRCTVSDSFGEEAFRVEVNPA